MFLNRSELQATVEALKSGRDDALDAQCLNSLLQTRLGGLLFHEESHKVSQFTWGAIAT